MEDKEEEIFMITVSEFKDDLVTKSWVWRTVSGVMDEVFGGAGESQKVIRVWESLEVMMHHGGVVEVGLGLQSEMQKRSCQIISKVPKV